MKQSAPEAAIAAVRVCVAVAACTGTVIAAAQDFHSITRGGIIARDVRYPSYDRDGVLRSEMSSAMAITSTNGDITMTAFVLDLIENAGPPIRVKGEACLFSPSSNTASSDRYVGIEYGGTVMSGTGFEWRESKVTGDGLTVRSNVCVNIADPGQWSRAGGGRGAVPLGATGEIVVTSSEMDFVPNRRVALFRGNVVVTNGACVITSDSADVLFTVRSTMKHAEAEGNVRIIDTGSTSTADKAFVDIKAFKVVLSGNARVEQAGESLAGEKITVFRRSNRVVVESPVLKLKDGDTGEGFLRGSAAEN